MRSRRNKGQIRIIEAMITCIIVIAGLSYAIQLSNVYTTSRTADVEVIAENILNVIDDPKLMAKIFDNTTLWEPELDSLIANLLPPDTFYTLTIRSALDNDTIGELTNLQALNASSPDKVSVSRVVTISLPISRSVSTSLDVMLIMDVSGSMSYRLPGDTHSKIYYAKLAASSFIDQLNASRDTVGVTKYETVGHTAIQLTSDFASIKDYINRLAVGGWTDIGDGIGNATIEVQTHGRSGNVIKVMILLSDGIANRPPPNAQPPYTYARNYALAKAVDASALPVRFYTIGLGPKTGSDDVRVDEPLLQSIAASSDGGKYYYAPSAEDLAGIYQSIASDLLFSVKYDLITLELTILRP
ncbi:MAG TPA: vWA domain-containing protein [Candidatus Bathyarchaeia archaeon]|nr:vWA domain-containing protein [Candidatus Bathyarchaeia archaeon]